MHEEAEGSETCVKRYVEFGVGPMFGAGEDGGKSRIYFS